jgi:hypothetical protein
MHRLPYVFLSDNLRKKPLKSLKSDRYLRPSRLFPAGPGTETDRQIPWYF